jgi:DNA repair protein RadA/Sms
MAKKQPSFMCLACGGEFPRWLGKCPECGEWNSLVKSEVKPAGPSAPADATPLADIVMDSHARAATGIAEFDLACGGGLVPGSVILIGGDPGIGKSTLALQVAGSIRCLYVSGEESPPQIRLRAERVRANIANIEISTATSSAEIVALIGEKRPGCVIIDSIQTLHSPGLPGAAGSPAQIRESASRLIEAAKRVSVPVILIGHITKDGLIAGPKMLEHMVDTVLYFEGDFSRDYRVLRCFKNRYGSVNEIGLFRMTERGLEEVRDRNAVFLNPYASTAPGNAVSAAIEGSRTILFEVQALVTTTSYSNPRRMSDGFDYNRIILITAVLEKHALLNLGAFDVFINVAGGFTIGETAADLAVAVSIASSLKGRPVPHDAGFLGEISLSGEIRPVAQCGRRALEFGRSGFKTLYVSRRDLEEAKQSGFKGDIIPLQNIAEAMDRLF